MDRQQVWIQELIEDVQQICEINFTQWSFLLSQVGFPDAARGEILINFKESLKKLLRETSEDIGSRKTILQSRVQLIKKRIYEVASDIGCGPMKLDENENLFEAEAYLKSVLTNLDEELQDRRKNVESIQERQDKVCATLGRPAKHISTNPLPSAEELTDIIKYIEGLELECFHREEKFIRIQLQIRKVASEIDYNPANEFEEKVLYNDEDKLRVNDRNMRLLNDFYKHLSSIADKTKSEYECLIERIKLLWESLDKPKDYRESFLKKHENLNNLTVFALKEEVKELELYKKKNIEMLVKNLRAKLIALWDKYYFSANEREDFLYIDNGIYNETIFNLFQNEISKVTNYYEENRELFDKLVMVESCWGTLNELEAQGATRLRNRGGQLLQEEKRRKATKKKIEKLEQEIAAMARNYSIKTNEIFTFKGHSAEEFIKSFYENKDKEIQESKTFDKILMKQNPARMKSTAMKPLESNLHSLTSKLPNKTGDKRSSIGKNTLV